EPCPEAMLHVGGHGVDTRPHVRPRHEKEGTGTPEHFGHACSRRAALERCASGRRCATTIDPKPVQECPQSAESRQSHSAKPTWVETGSAGVFRASQDSRE